ncbi:MAG: hypothetical protein E7321_00220 [Clostridiales bacterium]|nr:hypothetical protein [Clostridiales bacterium]
MKKFLAMLLLIVVAIPCHAMAESTYADGVFTPLSMIEGSGITLAEHADNGYTRALFTLLIGLSLNMDEDYGNDLDLTRVDNIYHAGFVDDYSIITLQSTDTFIMVFYVPNSEESFFSVSDVASSNGLFTMAQSMCDTLYKIDMQDFADAMSDFNALIAKNK